MIAKKYIEKAAAGLMILAVTLCLAAAACAEQVTAVFGGTGVKMEYETRLFDREEILSIDIRIEDEAWESLLLHAADEEYVSCDVIVNGETFYNVGIRPKGNTSLSAIAADPETDRYSFKVEFDHYVEGQSCYGLDKLILNNQYADATNMKEAVIYDMYAYLGADASLYNYAKVSVNGEYWGVYLALEAVEESFLLRCYGTEDGRLYKPESVGGGMKESADAGSGGADLSYTDDSLSSYSDIWDGEVMDSSKSDHERVVKALKQVHEGTDLEQYLDVDNILKYMAVHTFSVNLDSLSGMMAHNYYLYEYEGRLNILPWDYNLSFGGMQAGENSASDVINDAVDTPFSGTQFFDALLEQEEYLEIYHEYLRQLAQEYVLGGRFLTVYEQIRSRIDELVRTDPTAFYSYEEYEAGAGMFQQTVLLRAQSICGQLDGRIPSTDEGQRENGSGLVDASKIDISVMGTFEMGGNMERNGGSQGNRPPDGEPEELPEGFGAPPDRELGELPEGFGAPPDEEPGAMPEGFAMPPDGEPGAMPEKFAVPVMGSGMSERQQTSQNDVVKGNLLGYGICLCVILTALVIAKSYRRRRR